MSAPPSHRRARITLGRMPLEAWLVTWALAGCTPTPSDAPDDEPADPDCARAYTDCEPPRADFVRVRECPDDPWSACREADACRLDETRLVECVDGRSEVVDCVGVDGRDRACRGGVDCVFRWAPAPCVLCAPAEEACDGRDEDCDGRVDEQLASSPCTPEQGCGEGRAVCEGGRWHCDAGDGIGASESCDGLDADCDGIVDEDLPPGGPCAVGVGGCAAAGVERCVDGAVRCDAEPAAPAEETCDGTDEDCDGRVDEDWPVFEACAQGIGACRRVGRFRCAEPDAVVCALPEGPAPTPSAERCNEVDDDCDGRADEDYPLGAPCTIGLGACAVTGRTVCGGPEETRCDAEPRLPTAEACNGIDDDCDGIADEGFAVGESCVVGRGGCARVGIGACHEGALVCRGEPGPPAPERCDGVDDDCDGRVDEAPSDIGAPCEAGLGRCRTPGVMACVDGEKVCPVMLPAPRPERCDGVDDDCDGRVDEAPVDAGGPCAVGIGACAGIGREVCEGGALICDARPGEPQAERCNGQDDDCDGAVDEALPGLPCGEGICARLLPACVDGLRPVCDSRIGARIERCDGADDDCDGAVDEDFAPDTPCEAGVGACARVGRWVCAADGERACDAQPGAPADEVCNGLDDDCDGVVDEDVGRGAPCETGAPGRCARGVWACEAGQPACRPAPPSEERCDGEDDDCDGAVDEGLADLVCGVGACAHSIAACVDGVARACDPHAGAAPEVCNGQDDDCDGAVDEHTPPLPCVVGEGACAREGTLACVDGAPACDAGLAPGLAEVCNGLDDDCDGRADEDPVDAERPCAAGRGECRAEGLTRCVDGAVVCDAEPGAPEVESCNHRDDDCDGTIDETEDGAEAVPCGVACAHAIATCGDGSAAVCDPAREARPEVCDGLDDDCDGAVDEGALPDPAGACRVGLGQCAAVGAWRCVDGAVVCAPAAPPPGPAAEACNGLDDDCDGAVDEALEGGPCAAGLGRCAADGLQVCRAGVWRCEASGEAPRPEVCDGLDDDCDGAVDEHLGTRACPGCHAARPACVDGQPSTCPEAAADERCDGLDDDCDGLVDEGWPVDAPCGLTVGACTTEGRLSCTADGIACLGAPPEVSPEVCNDLDDDCDGRVDPAPTCAGVDRDGDGLTGAEEDLDGDGRLGPDETDPLDPDSDDDGIPDGIERWSGTDPRRADSDGDGIPDGIEDIDRDGELDPTETDPRSACSPDPCGAATRRCLPGDNGWSVLHERSACFDEPGGSRCAPEDEVIPCAPAADCVDGHCFAPEAQPGPGEVRITELMPDPAFLVDDVGGRWIELSRVAERPVDLAGCHLGDGAGAVQRLGPLPFAGRVLLLAGDARPAPGVELPADGPLELPLGDAAGVVELWCGGRLVDRVAYGPGTDLPAVEPARALALDPDALDPAGPWPPPDRPGAAWCRATAAYFVDPDEPAYSHLGTPGAPNPECPTADVCRIAEPHTLVAPPLAELEVTAELRLRGWTDETDGVDAPADLQVQLGFGERGTAPATWVDWRRAVPVPDWSGAAAGDPDLDRYTVPFVNVFGPDDLDYLLRYSTDGGASWRRCAPDTPDLETGRSGRLLTEDEPCEAVCLAPESGHCDGNLAINEGGEGFCLLRDERPVCRFPGSALNCRLVGGLCREEGGVALCVPR